MKAKKERNKIKGHIVRSTSVDSQKAKTMGKKADAVVTGQGQFDTTVLMDGIAASQMTRTQVSTCQAVSSNMNEWQKFVNGKKKNTAVQTYS